MEIVRSTSAEAEMNEDEQSDFQPLSVIPVEMWEHILEKLDASKDVRSFCKAWPDIDWDAVLHVTKSSWLFDEIFPLIFNYLTKKEQILLCRLVCKKWCKAIDQFLESNPCHRPSNNEHCYNTADQRLGMLTKSLRDRGLLHASLSSEKIAKILQSSNGHFRNPIIGRSVRFGWSNDSTPLILSFLSKFGQHIWDFRIEIRADNPIKLFQTLESYLSLLPNLKRLEIFGETTLVIEQKVEENLKELQGFKLALSTLPHLEILDINVFNQYQDVITEIILNQYAPTLRRLTINPYTIPLKMSPNLQNLNELFISVDYDKQLEALAGLNLPLNRLSIFILRNSNRGSYPNFSKVFQTINCFSSTLRSLSVEFPVTYSPIQWSRQSTLPTLQLPHLKTLELKEATFRSFNFLCQLSSLEYLYMIKYRWGHSIGLHHHYGVVDTDQHQEPEEERLDLKKLLDDPTTNSGSDRFYHTNLWKVLPRLRVLTISKASNATANVNERSYRRREQKVE